MFSSALARFGSKNRERKELRNDEIESKQEEYLDEFL